MDHSGHSGEQRSSEGAADYLFLFYRKGARPRLHYFIQDAEM